MNRLFGGLLIGVGILMMALSGLCSAAIIIVGFAEAIKDPSIFIYPLLFGGVPMAIGFGLFKLGQWLTREAGDEGRAESAVTGAPTEPAHITDSPPKP